MMVLPEPTLADWMRLAAAKRRPFPSRRRQKKWKAVWQFERMAERLSPADIVIDCGASDGACTRRLAANGATVHAFEPDPHGFAALQQMFSGSPNICLYEQAVGIDSKRAELFRSVKFNDNPDLHVEASTLYAADGHVVPTGIAVDQIDLPAWIAGLPQPVAILKMDIEGAEVPILERLFDTGLISRIGSVFVETHERIFPALAARTLALRQRVERKGRTNICLDWV